MTLFAELPYWIDALFAAFRILFWFVLLFGVIGPLFLSYTRDLPLIEKIVYSWVGLGGIIIFATFLLTVLHIYDFISMIITLLLIPLIVNFLRSKHTNFLAFLKQWELKTLVDHIRLIEMEDQSLRSWIKSSIRTKFTLNWSENSRIFAVLGIAAAGASIRMIPVLQHAAPFSSGWFSHLNRVKNLRLQNYFSGIPEPGGVHSLVSLFSMLTQVSPEMILHLLGAITSFFLAIIIYWCGKDLTKNRYPLAPVAGMAIFALFPLLFMPVSFDQEIDAGSLKLALSFTFPTITIFIRNLRNRYKSHWFYVLAGFIATGMTNLFVAFIVLFPLMVMGLATLPRRNYLQSVRRVSVYLLSISLVVLVPYLAACYYFDVDIGAFLLTQLYNVHIYSYYPFLILPLEELSTLYIMIAGTLSLYYIGLSIVRKGEIRDELIYMGVFILASLFYTPLVDFSAIAVLDVDQLNAFYAVAIAIFASIIFSTIMEVTNKILKFGDRAIRFCSWTLLTLAIGVLLYVQGGMKISLSNPDTVPNGFLEAYYQIIDDRLPYTYATVGPKVQRIMAKNRNYFMDYEYFLSEYSRLDSLYHRQKKLARISQEPAYILPASIFVFVEKPPYKSIQQGILYDSPSVMQSVNRWLAHYRTLPNRTVEVFYSTDNTVVYEIVNRKNESKIQDILYHIYPGDQK